MSMRRYKAQAYFQIYHKSRKKLIFIFDALLLVSQLKLGWGGGVE
jgi:hypothetical protein